MTKISKHSLCITLIFTISVVMAVAIMSVTSVHQDAFAKDAGMSLTAVAEEDGNIISVSGETTSNITDVTLRVISPNGQNVVAVDQVTPDANGEFSTQFNVSSWTQDGMYEIKANQGTSLLYSITVSVDVNGGMTAETSTTESSVVENYSNSDALEVTSSSTESVGGLSISANAMEGSDTIEITGQTSKTNQDVTFTVTSPNGNLVSVDQVSTESSGNFATDILVGGPLWSQDGAYTVTAQQGNNWKFADSVEIRIIGGLLDKQFGYGITSDQNKQYHNDCTPTDIKWDKKIERGEDFTITWSNPDTNNCRYDVLFYNADKSDGGISNSVKNSATGDWDSIGTKYFKICPTNENFCKSPFYSFTLEDTNSTPTASAEYVVFIIVGVVVVGVISIILVSKKNNKKSQTSTTVPSQEENNTDIDKQIAINEEKIRKIEEESKRLDEEN